MPVKPVFRKGKKAGYRWGKHGKLYACQEYGCDEAENLAGKQGRAAYARGYGEK